MENKKALSMKKFDKIWHLIGSTFNQPGVWYMVYSWCSWYSVYEVTNSFLKWDFLCWQKG